MKHREFMPIKQVIYNFHIMHIYIMIYIERVFIIVNNFNNSNYCIVIDT
jgi:hypothetical protein